MRSLGARRGQTQNLFTSWLGDTQLPSARFQAPTCQGAKSLALSSARDYVCSTGASGPGGKTRGTQPSREGEPASQSPEEEMPPERDSAH